MRPGARGMLHDQPRARPPREHAENLAGHVDFYMYIGIVSNTETTWGPRRSVVDSKDIAAQMQVCLSDLLRGKRTLDDALVFATIDKDQARRVASFLMMSC